MSAPISSPEQRTTGVYVHLPFCRVRCSYCPFAISLDLGREGEYFDALIREIEHDAAGELVESLYFGGGTPSRSSPAQLRRLRSALDASFAFSDSCEVTLEANPEDVDAPFVDLLRELRVNRVSLGVQSLNDEELQPIGRGHASNRAVEAIERLVASGLRVTADLIIGLPKQSRASFLESLQRLVDLRVGHVSLYMLDLEEGTALENQVRRGRVVIPDDEAVADLYVETVQRLETLGFAQYEISNFARPGEESRHNLRYWSRLPYKGYGLGAHAFDGAERSGNARELDDYIARIAGSGSARVFREVLTPEEREHEELFLALRQRRGIGYAQLIALRGEEGNRWIERGLEEQWLQRVGERVAFTPSGFVLSSTLIADLF